MGNVAENTICRKYKWNWYVCGCIESTCAARQAEGSTGSVKELTGEPHTWQREGAHQVWTAVVALAAALKPPETARQAGAPLAA